MGELRDAAKDADEPRPLVGGRYRLESVIGEGGMAEVWAAHDVRLTRPVALKFLTLRGPGESAEQTMQRFLREARIAAAVRHPNVVDVLDFGADEVGRPYMVMELLEGESLEDRLLRAGSLELDELLQIALDVLTGLDVVHRAGIVHRDLKPANVFLLANADPVRVKLLDFGVSRAKDVGRGPRSAVTTMQGRLVGTPAYMASEQARGRSDVDLRADLYSLGAMLYEGITGRLPYEEEATGDLIIAIAAGGAPSVAELRPEAGVAISALIERAMSVEREDRFESANEMRAALVAVADTLGHDVRPSLPMPQLARQAHGIPTPGSDVATIDAVPALSSGARPANGTPHFVAPRARRRHVWAWAAASLLIMAVSGGSFVWLSAPEPAPDASLATAAAAAPPAPIAEPTRGTAALAQELDSGTHVMSPDAVEAAPTTVRLVLRDLPAQARVFVDGERVEVDGDAVELPRDGETHRLEARLRGQRWRARHVADQDTTIDVRMTPIRARRPARSGGVFRELDY